MINFIKQKNDMKKLAYIVITSSMFLTTSCVDLTQEPQSFITEEEYIARMDLTSLQQATTGLYNDLWNGNYGFNCRLQRINVCADDITYRAAKANNELANYYRLTPNITANNADYKTTWELFFTVINNANKLINKAVLPEDATLAKQYEEVLGEAYFLRGLSYFYLVRMYGDLPLILTEEDAATNMPRTAVADIYDQAIIPSLKKAVELLPTKSRSGFSSTPSKWAAEACLADAYMTMAGWPLKQTQYYASAAEQAKAVIDGVNGGTYEYILEPEYKYVYAPSHNYTNETVVGINFSSAVGTWSEDSQMTNSHLFESLTGWGDALGEIKFWKEFPSGPRKDATYNPKILEGNKEGGKLLDWWDESIPEQQPMFCAFTISEDGGDYDYTKPANTSLMTNDHRHRLIRYSEVLLWYAEAQARADGTPNAMAYECINQVRERAGLEPLQSGMSGEAFANAALKEHGWEVAGYFVALVTRRDDQMRMELLEQAFNERKANTAIEVAPGVMRKEKVELPASLTWQGEKSIYLPYPASDTQLNPNLTR